MLFVDTTAYCTSVPSKVGICKISKLSTNVFPEHCTVLSYESTFVLSYFESTFESTFVLSYNVRVHVLPHNVASTKVPSKVLSIVRSHMDLSTDIIFVLYNKIYYPKKNPGFPLYEYLVTEVIPRI